MTLSQETREAVDAALAVYDADEVEYVAQATACGDALHLVMDELTADRTPPPGDIRTGRASAGRTRPIVTVTREALAVIEPAALVNELRRALGRRIGNEIDVALDSTPSRAIPTTDAIAAVIAQFWAETDTPLDAARAVRSLMEDVTR